MKSPSRVPLRLAVIVLASLVVPTRTSIAQDAGGGAEVFTVVDTLVGAVGGVTTDRLGDLYVADFG
jgi:hypothetical protein